MKGYAGEYPVNGNGCNQQYFDSVSAHGVPPSLLCLHRKSQIVEFRGILTKSVHARNPILWESAILIWVHWYPLRSAHARW